MDKHSASDKIYKLHNTNLGDHIRSLCMYSWKGQAEGAPLKVSTNTGVSRPLQRLYELSNILDHDYLPILVDQDATEPGPAWATWATPVVPVIPEIRWNPRKARALKTVTYQLDSASAPQAANPSLEHESIMVQGMENLGYQTIRLGSHMSLWDCAEWLSCSTFFFGVDSGMAHLANCVGTPVFMYDKDLPLMVTHYLTQICPFKDPYALFHLSQHLRTFVES